MPANGRIKTFDKERIEEFCLKVHTAYQKREGIFRQGLRPLIPRHNIPKEFEYSPPKIETYNPIGAAKYLFLMDSMERQAVTKVNIRNAKETWRDPEKRWIFNPEQVASKTQISI